MIRNSSQARLIGGVLSQNIRYRWSSELVLSALFVLVGSLWFHWGIITSGFDLVYGDYGDNRLSMMLMEHWYNAFSGQIDFRNPIYFYPTKDVLGFTDSYFLFSLPYSLARLTGLTEYGAFQAVIIFFNVFAFFAMYWFLRRVLLLDILISNVIATVFAFSNVLAVNMGHMQFLSIAFLPFLTGMLFRFMAVLRERPNCAFIYGSIFFIVFPLLAFTSFYTAWFYSLYLLVMLAVLMLIQCLRREWGLFARVLVTIKLSRSLLISILMVGLLASIPFLITYGPPYLQRGGFVPDDLFISTIPHPLDLINVGSLNAVWGHLLGKLIPNMSARPSAYELNMGFPLVFAALLLIGTIVSAILWKRESAPSVLGISYTGLAALFGSAVLVCLILIVNWRDGYSLWWFVRSLVPGAKAIRVVSRFQLILLFPACVTVAMFLSYVKPLFGNMIYSHRSARLGLIIFSVLLIVLFAEQSSPVYARVSKGNELSKFSKVAPPPPICKVFALAGIHASSGSDGKYPDDADQAIIRQAQVDAIYIAYKYKVPTVNGLSSLTPVEYWMFNLLSPFYTVEVGEWLARHKLINGVCTFDIESNIWREIEPHLKNIPIGENLLKPSNEKDLSDAMSFSVKGLSGAGFDGDAWTSGDSKFEFVVPARVKSISLSFYVVNPAGSNVKISVNGHLAHDEQYQGGMHTVSLEVPTLLRSVEISTNIFVPRKLNKKSLDNRPLGILMTDVRLSSK